MSYDQLRKGRVSETDRAYVVTPVSARRERRYFADFACARLVVAEMRLLHESGDTNSLAWVVMPDHVHWLLQLTESAGLSEVVKRFKARSARRVNVHLRREGTLWQKAFYDRAVREEEDLRDICPLHRGKPNPRRIGGTNRRLPAVGYRRAVGANLFAHFQTFGGRVRMNSHLRGG